MVDFRLSPDGGSGRRLLPRREKSAPFRVLVHFLEARLLTPASKVDPSEIPSQPVVFS
jgi:hypothetical protein